MQEIHEIDRLEDYLQRGNDLRGCVIQGLNLGEVEGNWDKAQVEGAVFLGCIFPNEDLQLSLIRRGALLFPRFDHLPYRPYRPHLYSREELGKGYTKRKDNSLDKRIYDHFMAAGGNNPNIYEALSQRLHDHAIDDALQDLLEGRTDGTGQSKKVVGVMGGHGTLRTDPYFEVVAHTARLLTREGFFIASGGGPGIMEAANLGAYLADRSEAELDEAIEMLKGAPHYMDPGYQDAAREVLKKYRKGHASLAVPTWFYGHEPSNLFSTYIAKYFSNSIREDGLLAIAGYGVVYAPGSAGTVQEIFMDAAQNHYKTFAHASPMIFLGKAHYEKRTGLYSTLQRLAEGREYAGLLGITEDPREVVRQICQFREDFDKG